MSSHNPENPTLSAIKDTVKEQAMQVGIQKAVSLTEQKTDIPEQTQQGIQTGIQLSGQVLANTPKKSHTTQNVLSPESKQSATQNTTPTNSEEVQTPQEEVSAAAMESIYEQVQWQILVDGKQIKRIVSFELKQAFNTHHFFQLRVYHAELEQPRAYRIDQTQELLGKHLTAILGSHLKEDRIEFTGIITSISFIEANGLNGDILVSGYSPTILLDNGPHLNSFYNKNLQTIAKEVTDNLAGKLDVAIQPRYTQQLTYAAQYQESGFAFLNRLSSWYGEWFYYNGKKLCLGKPDSLPKYTLYYARQIEGLQMNMQVLPMNFSHLSYQSTDDTLLKQQSPQKVDGLNYYADMAVEKSDTLFSHPVKNKPIQRAGTPGSLEQAAKVNKAVSAAGTFSISGDCKTPYLSVGYKVKIMLGETELGEYLITEITHHLGTGGKYISHFKAIAGDVHIIPSPVIPSPSCEPELAVVRKNDDPQQQGRVRVQFQWQDGDNMSDWIRVMSPDAGGNGDKVAKNRGFVFIPEEGDLVMVGYKDGNPDAPFVLGSLHHGKIGSGGGKGNKTKSLTTRSGSTVTLDDDKGSVTVSDPSGNTIILHGDGTMTIKAPNKLTIESKEIHVLAENDLEISSANTKVDITAQAEINVTSKGSLAASSTKEASIKSTTTLKMNAPSIETAADASLKMQGVMIDLQGQAITTIKGGIVNIN
ncbi:phage baseplate assembly protein V [Cytophagaceae bacterium DM2B3-1]|uniref:Phage baseplate assembly protein V n=1 Tax=Xanthocytophaga flava TaxID=3048013 RepID=A0ABT7CKY1_9BACT|nr:phage baseplate assembly protein V [Xanthocytophaga flavus]MDJ1493625.1 phage baseplate assembly protein V [Xanthocytophaga flavus]